MEDHALMSFALTYVRWCWIFPKNVQKGSDNKFLIRLILFLFFVSLPIWACLSYIAYAMTSGKPYSFIDIIDVASILTSAIGLLLFIAAFSYKNNEVIELLKLLRDDTYGVPTRFEKTSKIVNAVSMFCAAYACFGTISLSAIEYLDQDSCENDKILYKIDKPCGYLVLFWAPFDSQSSPAMEIYSAVLAASCTLITSLGIVIISLIFGVNELMIKKIQHLKEEFKKTFDIYDDLPRKKHFYSCIAYHSSILRIGDQINNSFGQILLIYITFGSSILSLLGYGFSIDHTFKSFIHFAGWFNCLLMICYTGQRLIDEGNAFVDEIYSMEWYNGNVTLQKDFLFVLKRSHIIMSLNAMGFSKLSLKKFSAMLQNTYSFIALLSQTTDPDNMIKNAID